MSNIAAVAGEKEKVVLGAVDIYVGDYNPNDTFDTRPRSTPSRMTRAGSSART